MRNIFLLYITGVLISIELLSCVKTNPVNQPETSTGFSFVNDGKGGVILSQYVTTRTTTNVVIPSSYDGYPVTGIANAAFLGATNMQTIAIPPTVTSIGIGAFAGCTALKSILLPHSVVSIGYAAFANCKALTTATIIGNVTTIPHDIFDSCISLTNVSLPSTVTLIDYEAFQNCVKLSNIILPSSVTMLNLRAFNNSGLTSITLSENVIGIAPQVFWNCGKLTTITVASGNPRYSSDANGVLLAGGSNKDTLVQYPRGNTAVTYTLPTTVTYIADSAFYNDTFLTNIVLPTSLVKIGVASFYGNKKLAGLTTGSTTGMFDFSSTSIKAIGNYAFQNCSALTGVAFPTTLENIGNYAFTATKLGGNIVIPANVTYIGTLAFSSSAITGFSTLGNTTYSTDGTSLMNVAATTLYQYANGATATSYTIPTTVNIISANAFANTKLQYVYIPASVNSIGANAFTGCTVLDSIAVFSGNSTYISDTVGVLYLSYNSAPAVLIQYPLKRVYVPSNYVYVLPNTITAISNGAFYNASNIAGIKLQTATPPSITSGSPSASNVGLSTASSFSIQVPYANIYAYQSALGWNYYINQMVGY